ncbi:MAG TPA: MG2 domain-containing protein [Acidobacteriota bacterium]|jgi:hypothetical protein
MKRNHLLPAFLSCLLLITATPLLAQQGPRIEVFSPQGEVKQVRQVRVQFSEAMIPFGDPRETVQPFEITCPEKGTGRWADTRNWIYDFERDLPAGIQCEFKLKTGLKTLSGKELTGPNLFRFSTGGPAIRSSIPYEGSQSIDSDQIFVLELDAEPVEASVLGNVYFNVEGVRERVGVRIVTGEARTQILKTDYRYRRGVKTPLILIQARQSFPPNRKVSLVWGKGVTSKTGVPSSQDQVLPFVSRSPFTADFSCHRENLQSACLPITPMTVYFSAPVSWAQAKGVALKGPGGKQWKAVKGTQDEEEQDDDFVHRVLFKAPFPEKSEFKVEMPAGLRDDAGRRLVNAQRFPLTVRTDEYPPLAKFAADFGILELNADPVLPVTVRNLEPEISGGVVKAGQTVPGTSGSQELQESIQGRVFKLPPDRADEILKWLQAIKNRGWDNRATSIFAGGVASPKKFSIPKPNGPKAFEVVGIPLKEPGFYVVELESKLLGAALLGVPEPMFVSTTALVTNLSVHFKWGIESSLVWVTTLDQARPFKDAVIHVRDCSGKMLWKGVTDAGGVARIDRLPPPEQVPDCKQYGLAGGLMITAQSGSDLSFVHSTWSEGIEPWRFQLSTEYNLARPTAHTIFDRTLLRAGETVHMKHILRRHVMQGFDQMPDSERPRTLLIEHSGSGQNYELPLKWDAAGVAESDWSIPTGAKLGAYQVSFVRKDGKEIKSQWHSGFFNVQEYRVPLMKGIIQFPGETLVAPAEVSVDLAVKYLAGGGAGNLPVKIRYQVQPHYPGGYEAFEDFVFANGSVKTGITRDQQEDEEPSEERKKFELHSVDLSLDKSGAARTKLSSLPKADTPLEVVTELEFNDPNGEAQTISSSLPLWPAKTMVGIKPESWASSRDSLKFYAAVADLSGKPVADAPVKTELFQRKTYSHRKRLIGGFYAYEHFTEVKRIAALCDGKTNAKGILMCETKSPVEGNVILQATSVDASGNKTVANQEVWIAGKDEWWFDVQDHDRMDVLPEKKRYEPGEKAKFQVRMPFRNATALVSVEREGISEIYIRELSGKEPVIEVPIKGNYAPNIYVSVLAVRGRVAGVQPTALVDLGRPAYKLGIAEISVGWQAHELKVKVAADRPVYKVREKAKIKVSVKTAYGKLPGPGTEIALAAVDEGLLELMPNRSWDLLESMMDKRGCAVRTSTAQMHVIGRRHFGLKALPSGGGGGKQTTRELFDTLLLWKGRVALDAKGEATVEVPLNDSLTSFRIVAVASNNGGLFGTGRTSIRTTQDLMILAGIAPLVRQGDRFRSEVTVRNATQRSMNVDIAASVKEINQPLKPLSVALSPGEAKAVSWDITAPPGFDSLTYTVEGRERGGTADRMTVSQKVLPVWPVHTVQATIAQLDKEIHIPVQRPQDAVPGRGGVHVLFRPTLLNGLEGVADYMRKYPYTCLEQRVSRAVALRDEKLWNGIVSDLPAYIDANGLAKYFPNMSWGSEVLTAYLVSIAHEADWTIPKTLKDRMEDGLKGFVEGKVVRHSNLPTADLSIRKLSAVEALSRSGKAEPQLLSSIAIEPNLWPTSAVLDWFNILQRAAAIPNREPRLSETEQILKSRLNFQGTTMGFSTARSDYLWWLMVSNDTNAVRLVLSMLESGRWKEDMPRIVRGALGRQRRGAWDLTVANAWGVLAMEKFSKAFESTPVTGRSSATLSSASQSVDWAAAPKGKDLSFGWPPGKETLAVSHAGTGKPWVTAQSMAAIPLKEPLFTGFRIEKSITPVEQKQPGKWSRGDIARVRLQLQSQSDMTWVVVSDPIPGGATILGSGLQRQSQLSRQGERSEGWVWPAFQEHSFEAYRVYYDFVPKGNWTIEYTFRLNNEGIFQLPATRAEALYSPEMFGMLPNGEFRVQ